MVHPMGSRAFVNVPLELEVSKAKQSHQLHTACHVHVCHTIPSDACGQLLGGCEPSHRQSREGTVGL